MCKEEVMYMIVQEKELWDSTSRMVRFDEKNLSDCWKTTSIIHRIHTTFNPPGRPKRFNDSTGRSDLGLDLEAKDNRAKQSKQGTQRNRPATHKQASKQSNTNKQQNYSTWLDVHVIQTNSSP